MALNFELEKLDGLDESIQKLYVEKDGKFLLDVTGLEKPGSEKIPKARLDQEISKRKDAEKELSTIADSLKADIPEGFEELVPELPPGKLISWIRAANIKGLFESKSTDAVDTKRPGDKKPNNLENLSSQQKMAGGYNKKK